MIFPTVHLGGTSGADLLDDYCFVRSLLVGAQMAMIEKGPNARDYYLTPGAWELARVEHEMRVAGMRNLEKEYDAIIDNIGAQIDEREARKAESRLGVRRC